MKTLLLTIFSAVLAIGIFAQIPQAFKYQFIARDNSGEVLPNNTLGIRIGILETSPGGPVLVYQETFTETTNQFGMISLEIGNGFTTLGEFSSINWSTGEKFIQLEIDQAGGTDYVILGTEPLLSVPFAMYSKSSTESPWEVLGQDIYYNTGKVGVGIESPLFTLDVRNPNEGETADAGVHAGPELAGGALSAYSSTFPAPLDHFAGRLSLWSNGMTANGLDIRADGASSDIRFYTGGFFSGHERMRIMDNGYVGIGSTEPETWLQVRNTAQFNPDLTLYGAKGNLLLTHINSGIQLGPYGPGLAFSGYNTTRRRAAIASVETSSDEDQVGLAFFTHPGTLATDESVVEYMRLTHGGNLGVGTESPETLLHVSTDTKFNAGNYSGREKGTLLLSQSGGSAGYQQCGAALAFSGINTSRRRAAIAAIQTDFDQDQVGLAFYTHPGTAATNDEVTKAMVITHDGLVGINNATPYYRLDVTGNIAVRDEATGIVAVEIGTGLDYAEGFDVTNKDNIGPGTVLCLDPDNPGKLKTSEGAYDKKVAGIVAGANQLGSGVILGIGQYDVNVALAGRVYCNVDASSDAVKVGDLLTTSDLPGYAKKATNPEKAQGAILGKAMESLEKGKKGQLLVLVTLQ